MEKMENVDKLLSDKFIEFSELIAELHVEKKKKKEELRKIYARYQDEFKELDDKAKEAQREFEEWKDKEDE